MTGTFKILEQIYRHYSEANFCTSAIIYWDENFLRSNFVKHQYKVCVELFLNYCRTAEEYFVQLRLLEFPFRLYFVTRYICLLKN